MFPITPILSVRRVFAAVPFLFLVVCAFAQTDQRLLHFNSGSVAPATGARSSEDLIGALHAGRYHVLVQAEGTAVLDGLRELGAIVGDYIPVGAWLVLVPTGRMAEVLALNGVLGVHAMQPAWKIHQRFAANDPPGWCVRSDGRWEVQVALFSTEANADAQRLRGLFKGMLTDLQATPFHSTWKGIARAEDVHALAELPFVQFIGPSDAPALPENYDSRVNQRSNVISSEYLGGPLFNGEGIHVMMNDDGPIGPHIDFTGRDDQSNALPNPMATHGDHVAGIIMGAGNLNPQYKGHAWGATIHVYNGDNGLYDFPEAYTQDGVTLTSTSQSDGCNTGYTWAAQLVDASSINHRSLLHVFSAGNAGESDCDYGAGGGWGNITGGHKAGKNCLTVGNVNTDDLIALSSSRGPATDGRLKPEVVATGVAWSTGPNNTYLWMQGTSQACPAVSGTLAQLYQAYAEAHNGELPPSALMKAVVMNTADDQGTIGPDFIHGFGRINARRAYRTLTGEQWFNDSITQGGQQQFTIDVPAGAAEVRVMLYWHDPFASLNAATALVNDLDLVVSDPAQTTWQPWVLNHAPNATTLAQAATRGADHLNNVEQVTLNNPSAGTYTITVSGNAINSGGQQEYFVVYEVRMRELVLTHPQGGESFTMNEQVPVKWDIKGLPIGLVHIEYSANNGQTWNTIEQVSTYYQGWDWTPPSIASGHYLVRVSSSGYADTSIVPFSVLNIPAGLSVDTICPGEVSLSWDPVYLATGYEVFLLGARYMEPQGTTTATSFTLTGIDTEAANWFSVRALGPNNAVGRRANAIPQPQGPLNCLSTSVADGAVTTPNVRVHPNPTRGLLTVDLGEAAPFQARLLDALGREVLHWQDESAIATRTLDLSVVAPGQYVLWIRGSVVRVVVQ